MSVIAPDPGFAHWLSQLKDVTEIQDPQGKVIGTFTPKSAVNEAAIYEKLKKKFDPAKTEKIFAEQHGKGRPLSEILKDLQAKEQQA